MRKLLVMLVGLLFIGGAGVRYAYSADDAKPASRPATVTQATPGMKIKATGTIEPEETANVCAGGRQDRESRRGPSRSGQGD